MSRVEDTCKEFKKLWGDRLFKLQWEHDAIHTECESITLIDKDGVVLYKCTPVTCNYLFRGHMPAAVDLVKLAHAVIFDLTDGYKNVLAIRLDWTIKLAANPKAYPDDLGAQTVGLRARLGVVPRGIAESAARILHGGEVYAK